MIARATLIAGLLVTAGLAVARAPLQPLPRSSAPEITVEVRLPEASDPATVTRAWVEPIEERIRALGRVVGHQGEVDGTGARWRIVFEPGTDPSVKAARLEAELHRLRRSLPPGGGLWIETAREAGGDLAAILWLRGDPAVMEAVAERLRSVPGVRTAELYGGGAETVWAEVPETLVRIAEEASRRHLRSVSLGRAGGDLAAIVATPSVSDLSRIPVTTSGGEVPLGELGALRTDWESPPVAIRWRGRPSRAVFVRRQAGAAPLRVRGRLMESVRSFPPGVDGEIYWSEAESLLPMLRTVAAGLVAASLGCLVWAPLGGTRRDFCHGLLALLSPWVLAAGAVHAAWLAGVAADAITVPALLLGCLGGFLVLGCDRSLATMRRRGILVGGAAGLGAAVALAGPEIAPWLGVPVRAFVAGVVGSTVAGALLPAFRPASRPWTDRVVRWTFREPMAAVLAVLTLTAAVAFGVGERLLPREGSLSVAAGDLSVVLRLPEGATLERTRRELEALEGQIAARGEVLDFWSVLRPGFARVTVDLRPSERTPGALRRWSTRWAHELQARGSIAVAPIRGTEGPTWARLSTFEERPSTDDAATRYRFVLRSTDLARLENAYEGVSNRLSSVGIRSRWIAGWEDPTVRLVLEPRRSVSVEDAMELASVLAVRTRLPTPIPVPGPRERSLRITFPGGPRSADEVPGLLGALGRPVPLADGRTVIPAEALILEERLVRPRVERRDGRFTVPVEIRFPFTSKQRRFEIRQAVHRSLGLKDVPTGVDLELPSLTPAVWQPSNLEMSALALAVAGVFLGLGTVALGSIAGGLVLLAACGAALIQAAGWAAATTGRPEALFVLGALGGSVLGLPVLGSLAAPWWGRGRAATSSGRYRRIRISWNELSPGVLLAAAALAPAWLVDLQSEPWAATLQGGSLAFLGLAATGMVLVPALGEIGERSSRDARREVRERRRPLAWDEAGRPSLEVRSLVKVYSGGVTAIRRAAFSLEPGIVGLLGPNGAGKTTLLRMLTGLLEPTRGSVVYRGVRVDRENLPAYRRRIGFLPQFFDAYPGFTAFELLEHWALEAGLEDRNERRRRIDELLDEVGLGEHRDRRVRDFSGGMKQRIGVARALLGSPPVLVVDEPTAGLDLESRHRFREMLLDAAGERIVVFSTHIASDLEAIAGRLLILRRGEIRFDGSPEALRGLARGRVFEALVPDGDLLDFARRHQVTARVREIEGVRVRAVAGKTGVEGELVEPGLEEAYLVVLHRPRSRPSS